MQHFINKFYCSELHLIFINTIMLTLMVGGITFAIKYINILYPHLCIYKIKCRIKTIYNMRDFLNNV